jgi:hypothetical protein
MRDKLKRKSSILCGGCSGKVVLNSDIHMATIGETVGLVWRISPFQIHSGVSWLSFWIQFEIASEI